jgi:uncharacterized membrane protein
MASMTKPMLILAATFVALFMVVLIRSGASAELRAAIRTTVIVALGWGLSYAHYGLKTWSDLSPQILGMLFISITAVVFGWLFCIRLSRVRPALPGAVTDRFNVGFAVMFATLFLCQNFSAQSLLIAVILVSSVVVLAFGSR